MQSLSLQTKSEPTTFEAVDRDSFFKQIPQPDGVNYTHESFSWMKVVGEGTYGKVYKAKVVGVAKDS